MIILETERLLFRERILEDLEPFCAMEADPERGRETERGLSGSGNGSGSPQRFRLAGHAAERLLSATA